MFFFIIFFNSFVSPAYGETVTEVYTTGPAWETFTHEDGTGLYHEVLDAVFALYGITVKHEYVPTNRGDELVLSGQADMMICDDRATSSNLHLSRYPLYVNDYHVFYNKETVGQWQGVDTLRNREVVCQLGYYHEWDFSVPVHIRDMSSGIKCLQMILMGRSDFYVDDRLFIEHSIEVSGLPFNRDEYDCQVVGTRSYHPVLGNTQRADQVMRLFDEGIMALHKAGKLAAIYEKWGHQYPDFDRF
nr:transporter substrate-binding domain-containing protein [Pseudodesulfovibrio sp. JC047]